MRRLLFLLALVACRGLVACRASGPPGQDPSQHTVRTVDLGKGVSLELLDWGGHGRPVLLLAGLGNSAHIFDEFAPAFVDRWRVLGLSRRGFGGSTAPSTGHDVPTLGTDIVRTLDALQIDKALLVGHSIAGEEMTWLAGAYPERVEGLVYIDAAYDRVALDQVIGPPANTPEPTPTLADLASPAAYAAHISRGMRMPIPVGEVLAVFTFDRDGHFVGARGDQSIAPRIAAAVVRPDYDRVHAPTLALFAVGEDPTTPLAVFNAAERERFARAVPTARVIAIPHSRHYLFLTNRDEVVREVRAFLAQIG